jgi:protein SCO1/2
MMTEAACSRHFRRIQLLLRALMTQTRTLLLHAAALLALCLVSPALLIPSLFAQQAYSAEKPVGTTAQQLPAYLAHAGVEQRLGQPLPLTAPFTDENGQTAPLGSFFHQKPVVLALVYYKCAMLCPQVLHGLATGLAQTTLTLGKDYDVLVFSIDPSDTPADAEKQRQSFLKDMNVPPASADAVHFLTAQPASIAAISGATGFHYILVPGPDGKMDQFAHSSVIMFATPDGHLSKYLSGVDYPARDLRMALLDASAHKISNPVDLLILYCCSYNPVVGKYSVSVLRILSLAGMFSVVAVVGMLFLLTRKPKGHATA